MFNRRLFSQMIKASKKDISKGIAAGTLLVLAFLFLSVGDAYNKYWFALFFENIYTYALISTVFVYATIKSKIVKRIYEVVILYFLFYIVFNIAILFEPFNSYKDFTSNPVICVQILWCIIGFSIFQLFRK